METIKDLFSFKLKNNDNMEYSLISDRHGEFILNYLSEEDAYIVLRVNDGSDPIFFLMSFLEDMYNKGDLDIVEVIDYDNEKIVEELQEVFFNVDFGSNESMATWVRIIKKIEYLVNRKNREEAQ